MGAPEPKTQTVRDIIAQFEERARELGPEAEAKAAEIKRALIIGEAKMLKQQEQAALAEKRAQERRKRRRREQKASRRRNRRP